MDRSFRFAFANGLVVSVINDGYGSDAGLLEVAVFTVNEEGRIADWQGQRLLPDVFTSDDVAGWLTAEDVVAILSRVAALPTDVVQ